VAQARFSTVVGLVQYGAHRVALGATTKNRRLSMGGTPTFDRIAQKAKTWLQDFF
jgi:hypothetical protein